jgi:hypothetical protein
LLPQIATGDLDITVVGQLPPMMEPTDQIMKRQMVFDCLTFAEHFPPETHVLSLSARCSLELPAIRR